MPTDEDLAEEATDTGKPPPAFDTPPDFGDFEGKPVVGIVTSINGTSSRINRPIHPGERGYALVEWSEAGIAHKPTKEGRKRHQTLGTEDVYELDAELGRQLVAAERQKLLDAGLLFDEQLTIDDGIAGVTDENGVALTPAELAEARGGVDGVDQLAPPAPGEPWFGYDGLDASEVRKAIAEVESIDALQAVIAYENSRSRPRQQVINAAAKRRDDLEAAEPR